MVTREADRVSKRKAEALATGDHTDIVEVDRGVARRPLPSDPSAGADGAGPGEGADDDCVVTGIHGALVDFPHARENCARHMFRKEASSRNLVFCANCFCYVCDIPASDCDLWQAHCDANTGDAAWRQRRAAEQQRARALAGVLPYAAARGSGGGGGGGDGGARAARTASQRSARYSCDALLAAVLRVHPVEAPCPAGVRATLRHYQRQSLAFMLSVERGDDATLPRPAHTLSLLARLGGDWGGAGGTAGVKPALRAGGWLCDAMGMGKTLVCAALVAADKEASTTTLEPAPATPEPAAAALAAPAAPAYPVEVRTTVVFAAISLLGQWADELAKWAPHLKVVTIEKNARMDAHTVASLVRGDYDLVITTRTVSRWAELAESGQPLDWTARHLRRVIYDESHTLPSVKSAQFVNVQAVRSTFRWAVTGTPFTSSVKELEAQAEFVGHWRGGVHLASWVARFDAGRSDASRTDLTRALQRVMMRHAKEQQIAGANALALPRQDVRTHVLDMSADERAAYDEAVAYESARLKELCRTGARAFALQQALRARLQVCAHVPQPAECNSALRARPAEECTKFHALREALRAKRRAEPAMHAVVFTQHVATHERIARMLRADGFAVLAFSGSTAAAKRATHIRAFQSLLDAPRQGGDGGGNSAGGGGGRIAGGSAGGGGGGTAGAAVHSASRTPAGAAGSSGPACCALGTDAGASAPAVAAAAATATAAANGSGNASIAAPGGRHRPGSCDGDGDGDGDDGPAEDGVDNDQAQAGKAKVFVMTLRAGAVGITLTAADAVYLMEPCLDPATELQAAGRIHRLGQNREVTVHRYVLRGTVEESVRELHDRIRAGTITVADNFFTPTAVALLATK